MTLLVRDEEDILEANIKYHLAHGVDHIIITDNLSADNSPEIIHKYVKQGVATYISERDDNYAQSKWVSHMAQIAYESGARWVIHCDADEFWITPQRSSLRTWFNTLYWPNVVSAPRHDFVCLHDDGMPFWKRMIYRKVQSVNPLGKELPPKVAHRASENLTVAQGNHSVSGFRWMRERILDLEILHFPIRSRDQYIRKIEVGGRAYENNIDLPKSVGGTWRKQYTELKETGTLSFLEQNIISQDTLQKMLSTAEVVEDQRLSYFFQGNS